MYLDYSKLEASQIKQPALRLQTLAGKELGVIPWVSNLNFELNYADVSRVEFDVPRRSDGKINPVYRLLTSYKMLFTEQLGKDGGKTWYAVLKTSEDGGEPYWGREYVEVV